MTSTRILAENARTDGVTDKSYWDAASSASIEGFATDMSVNAGSRVDFKINLDGFAGGDYKVEIFRLGYYGGAGAREVTEWTNTNGVDQALPLYNAALGLVDAGNWLVTDSWNVPADAVSGVYIARLQRLDSSGNPIPGATNQIPFIVRNDGVQADIVLQTSDTTWQAYNGWTGGLGAAGGGATNLYGDSAGLVNQAPIPGASTNAQDRAYAVSYNRPFATRDGVGTFAGPHNFLYGADYSAIYFLEQQGYDVSYISGVDTDRLGPNYLQNYKAFISVGHDEYWSRDQRQNVEAARDAGVNVLFWSGNEVYWKIRWQTSISSDGTEYRTLVCYKETLAVADRNAGPEDYYDLDPTNVWTGTWRDMRFVDAQDANGNYIAGGSAAGTITGMLSECACVETMLTGQLFGPDGTGQFGGALEVPAAFANLRVWRDTNVPTTGIAPGIIGYEWDTSPTDATRPAGLIKLSETTLDWAAILIDQGMSTAGGRATHNLSLYRDAESGALVFGAGTVFWSWGLSDMHDSSPYAANIKNTDIQQFTINMFADMGIQPAVTNAFLALQGLSRAVASTDFTAATTAMVNLPDSIAVSQTIQITGTAADANGTTSTADDGKVAAVEVSLDGGLTWRVAQGTTNWSIAWTPTTVGIYTIQARAIDDSLNITSISVSQDTVTVTNPGGPNTAPVITSGNYTIPENGTAVGNVTAADFQGNAITYAISGGVDAARFTINATTGALAFVSAPNFEAPADTGANNVYDLIVSASDNIAAATTQAVTVTVADVNEAANTAPTITSGDYTIPENGTAVGSVTATDAQGNPITYAISGGVDAARFTINATTGALAFVSAPNFEAPADTGANNVYDLIVSASDNIAAPTTQAVTVTVTDVVESASSTLFAAGTTPAAFDSGNTDPTNYELGTRFTATQAGQITTLQYYRGVADADDTDVRAMSLWNSAGVKIGAVTVTSAAGATGWQVGTLTSPISIVAGATYVVSYSYVFNNGQGAVESFAKMGGYYTVARPSADGLLVAPVNAGVFAVGPGLFPTSSWNAANYFVDVAFAPASAVPNTAPVITSANYTINENATTVGSVTATDAQGNAITYAISGGVDAARFTINATTGALAFVSAPNFEAPADTGANNVYDLIVSASDGIAAPTTRAVTVTVTDVVEPVNTAPTITSGNYTINENATTVGSVTATDAQGNAITYAISGGVDAARFTINATTGALAFVSAPNFEAPADTGANNVYDLIVSASDNIAAATTQAVTVTVADVNEAANTAPTITSGDYTIPENGTTVGSVTATDAQGNAITYAISGGVDAARFTINATTGALAFVSAPNFEAPADTGANNVYDLIVSASDGIAAPTTRAVTVTVTDVAEAAMISLFGSTAPTGATLSNDNAQIELGMRFTVGQAGSITGLRYYRDAADANDTDVREGHLWSSTGALLGTVTFTSTAGQSGWQMANFSSPIALAVGQEYTVSYRTANNYLAAGGFFDPSREVAFDGVDDNAFTDPTGVISAAQNAASGNGVFAYGSDLVRPTSSWNAANYFVDVAFAPASAVPNTAPVITSANYTINENATTVGSVTATDAQGNAITYAISGGVDAARFTINATTGALAFVSAPNFEAPADTGANNVYDLIVSASDGIAAPTTRAVTVTVTDVVEPVNTAPTITSGNYTINENATTVGSVTATDAQGNAITYAISGGVDAARFTINATTGALAFVSAPNFEAPADTGANNVYDLIVSASDNIAAATTQAVTVTVADVNEAANTAPTITSGDYTIPENGTTVGSVTATDAQGNAITYAISGGVDAARFTINATTGALAFVSAPNFEAPADTGANNVYDLIVSASDGIAAPTTRAVTVTVTDVVEPVNTAPTITSGNYTINENATTVGSVTATDAQGNPITYAISGGVDAARFTINATTGALAFVSAPNFEAPADTGANNVYDLIVSASDNIAAPTTQAVTVTVTDVVESASSTLFAAGTTPAAFDSGNTDPTNYELGTRFTATQAGQITTLQYYRGVADADDTDVRAMSLWNSAGVKIGAVTVTSAAGATGWQVGTLTSPISIVAGATYVVSYSYVFNNGQGAVESFAKMGGYYTVARPSADGLLVAPVNAGVFAVGPGLFPTSSWNAANYFVDVAFAPASAVPNTAPVITSANYTINENATTVGSVTATDAQGNAITYAISGGVDAARFTINATTGALAFVSAPNFEAPADTGANNVYDLIVSASDNIAAATTQAVTVTVADVNEAANTAPTITSGDYTIPENGTTVGSVTATDAQGNAITYAISGGVDAARFTINATTGALAFVSAPNFEAPADTGANNVYDLIVSASDGIAAPTTRAVTVTVTDVVEPVNTAPTITSGNYTINENATTVGSVTATDAQGNPITYAISGGVDAARFTINATTGALAFVSAPNFEAPADTGANNVYDLIVSASDNIAAPTTQAVTVTVTDVVESASSTLFAAGTTPAAFDSGNTDPTNYELGTRFTATQAGQITTLQYYRGVADADDTDVRAMSLWNSAGVKIGAVTVTSAAGATGWQVGTLTSPISIVAGATYVVSYSYVFNNGQGAVESFAKMGGYYTVARPSADGLLVAPVNAGVFAVGPGLFPTSSWNAANYFVDVGFQPSGGAAPVVLDLTGNGLHLTSGVTFDFDGDGDLEAGNWIDSGNAFLALDRNGDGAINGISEISFVDDLPGAATDLQGLSAFDSNGDGALSADDRSFDNFLVWEDANLDGVSQATELRSLAGAGIASIDLSGRGPEYIDAQGNVIHGTTDVTLTSGATVTAYDVALNYADTGRTMVGSVSSPETEELVLASEGQPLVGLQEGDTIDFGAHSSPFSYRTPAEFVSQGDDHGVRNWFRDPELAALNEVPHHDAPHPSPFDILVDDHGII